MCCASAPGCSPGDRGHDVARPVRATAPRTGRPRRARGRSRAGPRGARPRAGRARPAWPAAPRGTSRAGSARPPPWPPRPRPRSATRPPPGGGTPSPRAASPRPGRRAAGRRRCTSSPDAIGTSARTPGGTCDGPVLRPVADVAAQRRRGRPRAAGRDGRGAEPRHDDRHRRAPAASAASWATRPSPSPPSTASTISRWTARSRSTSERWRAGSAGWAAAIGPLRDPLGLGGTPGWACSVSSPDSPVRMRYASSTGSTNTLPSPIDPVRACLRIVSTTVCTSPRGDHALDLDLRAAGSWSARRRGSAR